MDDWDGRREGREGLGAVCVSGRGNGKWGRGEGVKMEVSPGTEVMTRKLMIVNKGHI